MLHFLKDKMIEIDKTPRFKTADGVLHVSLADAQIHSLSGIISGCTGQSSDDEIARVAVVESAKRILKSQSEIIAILKMKPRKQKAKGASKPKSAPKAATVAK